MRLVDLDPKWLEKNGGRVGLVFRNPVKGDRGWWSSCFFVAMPGEEQSDLIEATLGEGSLYQICNPSSAWEASPGLASATFHDISITPSIDGGPGWWHGFITNGEIVGGI